MNSTLNDIFHFLYFYINCDDSTNYPDNPEYNYLIRKWVLLGICAIFTN